MDSIVVAVVSGIVASIVAVAVSTAFRSEIAAHLLDRAPGGGPRDLQAPVATRAANACPACGAPYPAASIASFCRHCGQGLRDAPRARGPARRHQPRASARRGTIQG
jgi:hypothetical protein